MQEANTRLSERGRDGEEQVGGGVRESMSERNLKRGEEVRERERKRWERERQRGIKRNTLVGGDVRESMSE